MKTIKSTSKFAERMFNKINNAYATTLWDCYKKFSSAKYIAYLDCLSKYQEENGWGFRIISWNTFQFTCGWNTIKGYRIETATQSYIIVK